MTNIGHRKRLREKFRKATLSGFHDYEIVELLLTYAIPRRDVKPEAKELIKRLGGLRGVFSARPEDLASVKGIGENASLILTLLREVAGAYLKEREEAKESIQSPQDVFDYLRQKFPPRGSECLLALYLNSKNQVLDAEVVCEAPPGLSLTSKGVIERAIGRNARSVILVHELGGAAAREGDLGLIREIEDSAATVDIIVHDYIIVSSGAFTSARSKGWLKGK